VRELGCRLQIGTTVCKETLAELPAIASLLTNEVEVDVWTLFFLVVTGRATSGQQLDAAEQDQVLRDVARARYPFAVRTVEAPVFRLMLAEESGVEPPAFGVGDGRGFCFVSHVGDVCPSGFLELPVGNVRTSSFTSCYFDAPLMRSLRSQEHYRGRCGSCDCWSACGGSRARAWATNGDPLGEDPGCLYQPHAPGHCGDAALLRS
jgi:radical SAM protein with 4Fe4S-binding SPASM domain